jgi:hypothetical protein
VIKRAKVEPNFMPELLNQLDRDQLFDRDLPRKLYLHQRALSMVSEEKGQNFMHQT